MKKMGTSELVDFKKLSGGGNLTFSVTVKLAYLS